MLATRTPKNAFFEFFLRRLSTTQPPALPVYPAGGDPSPQRTRTSYTSQAAAQTVQDAGQTTPRTDTHARTLDTLHRSALDTRQAARGRSVRRRGWMAWSASETVQIWTQRSGSKKYLICEYICCTRNAKPLYSVSKV